MCTCKMFHVLCKSDTVLGKVTLKVMHYNIASPDLINCYLVNFYGKYIYIGMASRLTFIPSQGYELLISAIAFPLEKKC